MERIGDVGAWVRRQRLSLRARSWWWVNKWGGGQCPPYWLTLALKLSWSFMASEGVGGLGANGMCRGMVDGNRPALSRWADLGII
jgi:hypothetical protein